MIIIDKYKCGYRITPKVCSSTICNYFADVLNIKPTDKEIKKLNQPEPRITTGIVLRDIATSCIDISDGLFCDLNHILSASNVGAEIKLSTIIVLINN